MDNMKYIRIFFIILATIFLSSLLVGCNDSDNDSGPTSAKKDIIETTWYRDADGDGYGDPSVSLVQATKPEGYVDNADDCDDYDPEVYPGAPDLCGGKDYNCDGTINVCEPDQQSVTGRITNMMEAQAYINDDSYLQIVFYPADGLMTYTKDSRGRRVYDSDLAAVDVPPDGVFSFKTNLLFSGNYVIAAQRLSPYDAKSPAEPILANTDDQMVIFSVSAKAEASLDVDLGNVRLPVPKEIATTKMSANAQTGPTPPLNVSASDGEFEDKIRVTWEASAGATSYEVYRADSFSGQKMKVTSTASTTHDDKSLLSCDVDFYYWVKAINSYGDSELFYSDLGYKSCPYVPDLNSNETDGINSNETDGNNENTAENSTENHNNADAELIFLPPPDNVSASDGTYPEKVRITWKRVEGADLYKIYRHSDCCGQRTMLGSTTNLYFDDMEISSAAVNYYWVKAADAKATSAYSHYDSGYRMLRPLPPVNVNASKGSDVSRIHVTWSPGQRPSSSLSCNNTCGNIKMVEKVDKYEIYRSEWSGGARVKIGTTSNTWFNDYDIPCSPCGYVYYYWIKAINAAGISPYSDYATGYAYKTIQDPNDIRATDGTIYHCIRITWSPIAGARSYNIFRSASLDGAKTKIGSTICDFYVDTTPVCPEIYYYWVQSVDKTGISSCEFRYYDTGYCKSED